MRQISGVELQKDDPLKRIQEEINEVARREQELRAITKYPQSPTNTHNNNDEAPVPVPAIRHHLTSSTNDTSNISISNQSDDSGISSSSSPINGTSTNSNHNTSNYQNGSKDIHYIRSNTINLSSTSSSSIKQNNNGITITNGNATQQQSQSKLTRAVSTPQIFVANTTNRFNVASGQKGIMQRFIASRGKIASNNNRFQDILTSAELNRPPLFLMSSELTPPIIERDEDGRPLRKGFVPVEEKIQRELRDIKSRESELKKIRRQHRMRQSQPDLLDNIDDCVDYDSEEDSENGDHCYLPGKLRTSKSISELCDTLNSNSSLSPRETPSPQPQHHLREGNGIAGSGGNNGSGMRPAVSLAQLCDVDPDEAPSSHRLIAQWENIIQKQQEVV